MPARRPFLAPLALALALAAGGCGEKALTALETDDPAYRDAKDLIEIGAYVAGTNPLVDRAIDLRDAMDGFLRQDLQSLLLRPLDLR